MDAAFTDAPSAVPLSPIGQRFSHFEIHLARLDVGSAERGNYEALLVPEERDRAARFHFRSHAERFVVRRGKLRALLAARLGCDARAVPLQCNDFGKPSVKGTDLQFNSRIRAVSLSMRSRAASRSVAISNGAGPNWRVRRWPGCSSRIANCKP